MITTDIELNDDDIEIDNGDSLNNLFRARKTCEEFLAFKSIDVYNNNENSTTVRYNFSYCNETTIEASFTLCYMVDFSKFKYTLLSIGLCKMAWYVMGYGCYKIILESSLPYMTNEMIEFWTNFYNNVLLEYLYVNKLSEEYIFINQTNAVVEHGIIKNYRHKDEYQLNSSINTDCLTELGETSFLIPLGGNR